MAYGRGYSGTPLEGLKASADLSSYQWHFVKMAGTASTYDYQVTVCAATTDQIVGVLMNKPDAAGKPANVLSFGSVAKVIAGGTINCGASVTTDSSGHAVTASGTDTKVVCIALTYGVSGDYISALLTAGGLTQGT